MNPLACSTSHSLALQLTKAWKFHHKTNKSLLCH